MLDSNSEAVRSARALHRVLIEARHLALGNAAHEQLVGILDWAELLADDIAAAEDRTEQFAEHLKGLGDDHPKLAGVARDYQDGRP
jgi:hypothetical protein